MGCTMLYNGTGVPWVMGCTMVLRLHGSSKPLGLGWQGQGWDWTGSHQRVMGTPLTSSLACSKDKLNPGLPCLRLGGDRPIWDKAETGSVVCRQDQS